MSISNYVRVRLNTDFTADEPWVSHTPSNGSPVPLRLSSRCMHVATICEVCADVWGWDHHLNLTVSGGPKLVARMAR